MDIVEKIKSLSNTKPTIEVPFPDSEKPEFTLTIRRPNKREADYADLQYLSMYQDKVGQKMVCYYKAWAELLSGLVVSWSVEAPFTVEVLKRYLAEEHGFSGDRALVESYLKAVSEGNE